MNFNKALTVLQLLRGNPARNIKNLNGRCVQQACDVAIELLKRETQKPTNNFEKLKSMKLEDVAGCIAYVVVGSIYGIDDEAFIMQSKQYKSTKDAYIKYFKSEVQSNVLEN